MQAHLLAWLAVILSTNVNIAFYECVGAGKEGVLGCWNTLLSLLGVVGLNHVRGCAADDPLDWGCQSHGSTHLHHSCRTDKGTSRRFPGQWHIPHTTAGNQTFPSSFPCRAALLFSSFRLQGAPQDPVPQRELLVWPLLGSLSPLCSVQSSPWRDHYRPVGSGSHLVLTACNGDELKSLFVSGRVSHWAWSLSRQIRANVQTLNVQTVCR